MRFITLITLGIIGAIAEAAFLSTTTNNNHATNLRHFVVTNDRYSSTSNAFYSTTKAAITVLGVSSVQENGTSQMNRMTLVPGTLTQSSVMEKNRRSIIVQSLSLFPLLLVALAQQPATASSSQNDAITTTATTNTESMKLFIDPLGLFVVSVPTRFYTVRRTAKGDLPDEKTGKGRRGSSIFTAGDMSKVEVVAIERFPTRVLLEENGIDVSNTKLTTFPDIGDSYAIANLITLRREKEKSSSIGLSTTKIQRDSIQLSTNGKELLFTLQTYIPVQKPELLLEQTGVSELVRITHVKASLLSNDDNMLIIFASALEQDFNGPDGIALDETVRSFQPIDQSKTT